MPELPDDMLRAFLAGRDFECPVCSYNLRDLQTTLCPECGKQIRLQVGVIDANLGALMTGLIGLAAAAGFNALLLLAVFLTLLRDHRGGPHADFLVLTLVPLVIEGTLLLAWVRNWRRMRRLHSASQWQLAIGCWAVLLLDLAVFSLMVK